MLKAAGGEVEMIHSIINFISWIARSDFLRLQQPEPIIGSSEIYPAAVDILGIKGKSVYTALFYHEDMETFTCRICGHLVMFHLEEAVIHQRDHFTHYPYQCLPTHTQWRVSSAHSL